MTQAADPTMPVPATAHDAAAALAPAVAPAGEGRVRQREVGGPGGPEPTRYGDWELRGRCIDF